MNYKITIRVHLNKIALGDYKFEAKSLRGARRKATNWIDKHHFKSDILSLNKPDNPYNQHNELWHLTLHLKGT